MREWHDSRSFRRFNGWHGEFGQAFNATVKRSETRERLLEDHEQLLKTLRDHEAGKIDHLGQRDRDHFVASVKRRIADLNEQIARLDGKT